MKTAPMNILRAAIASTPFAAMGLPASAGGPPPVEIEWNCTNPDLEISCPQGKCEVAEEHTSLSVTARADILEVCAYSGCWSGKPAASLQSGRFQTYTGVRLLYMLDTDDGAHASLTIDTHTGTGTLLVTSYYAQPMVCKLKD